MTLPLDAPAEPREARTPMALLPYQQRWAKDDAQVKVIEKSRRIGLSWGEAADAALLDRLQPNRQRNGLGTCRGSAPLRFRRQHGIVYFVVFSRHCFSLGSQRVRKDRQPGAALPTVGARARNTGGCLAASPPNRTTPTWLMINPKTLTGAAQTRILPAVSGSVHCRSCLFACKQFPR